MLNFHSFGHRMESAMVEAYQGREVLFYYLNAPLLSLFGDDIFTLHLSSALMGFLTIAVSMALGRAMFRGERINVTEQRAVLHTALRAPASERIFVDGVDVVNDNTASGVDTINAGLFPIAANESHVFQILDLGATTSRTVTLVSADVTSHPVQNVSTIATTNGLVGYMLFNDHLATSEAALVVAFTTLQAAGVRDLVLDIRYNGGGYLDIASEVAYMIAGPGPTTGKGFEKTVFNDKYPSNAPVTGRSGAIYATSGSSASSFNLETGTE